MKSLIKVLFISAASFLAISCNNIGATNAPTISQESGRVLLEVDSLSYASMDGFNGRNLAFRLFENGRFEYEEVSSEKLTSFERQAFSSEIIDIKKGQLTDEELKKIKEILANPDFQKTDWHYKNAEGFCTCGSTRKEIRYRNKLGGIRNVIIDGSDCADLTKPDAKVFPNFPKIISELLRKIQNIKYPDLKT